MAKISLGAALVGAVMFCGAAAAQTGSAIPPNPLSHSDADGLANRNNLTSTGATVPRPGATGDETPVLTGRSIHDANDHGVEKNICSNCSNP